MRELTIADRAVIPAMSDAAIARVRDYEDQALARPQVVMDTWHDIHAGMYLRTIFIPKGVEITGALIKIATALVFDGDALVNWGDGFARVTGRQVLLARAGRKQVFQAIENTWLTMSFVSNAKTYQEAEREFTDEADRLWSRHGVNHVRITGE